MDYSPDAASPAASGAARAVGHLLYILQHPLPWRSRLPPSPSHQLPCRQLSCACGRPPAAPARSRLPSQRAQRCPGLALSFTLTLRPPSGSWGRAVRLQPRLSWGTRSALFFLVPPAQAEETRGRLPAEELSWEWCLGRVGEGDRRTAIRAPRPAPRALRGPSRLWLEAEGLSPGLPRRAARPSTPSRLPWRPAPLLPAARSSSSLAFLLFSQPPQPTPVAASPSACHAAPFQSRCHFNS